MFTDYDISIKEFVVVVIGDADALIFTTSAAVVINFACLLLNHAMALVMLTRKILMRFAVFTNVSLTKEFFYVFHDVIVKWGLHGACLISRNNIWSYNAIVARIYTLIFYYV